MKKVAEGSGYNASDVFTLKVTPIIRAINVGIPGELDYLRGIPQDQNATNRTDTIRTAVNPDGTLRLGSGYVVSPRLRTVPTGASVVSMDRVELEPTTDPISVLSFQLTVNIVDRPDFDAILLGGFKSRYLLRGSKFIRRKNRICIFGGRWRDL